MCLIWWPVVKTSRRGDHNVNKTYRRKSFVLFWVADNSYRAFLKGASSVLKWPYDKSLPPVVFCPSGFSVENRRKTCWASTGCVTWCSWSCWWSARSSWGTTWTVTRGRAPACRSSSTSCESCPRTGSTWSRRCARETRWGSVTVCGRATEQRKFWEIRFNSPWGEKKTAAGTEAGRDIRKLKWRLLLELLFFRATDKRGTRASTRVIKRWAEYRSRYFWLETPKKEALQSIKDPVGLQGVKSSAEWFIKEEKRLVKEKVQTHSV